MGVGFEVDVRLARKNSPEMLSCSQRTTTIFWPFNSCLATVDARRPRRWPLPSTTTWRGRQYTVVLAIQFPLLLRSNVRFGALAGYLGACVPQARRSTYWLWLVSGLRYVGGRCVVGVCPVLAESVRRAQFGGAAWRNSQCGLTRQVSRAGFT